MSLQNKVIAFIGAGNMGEALIRGLLNAKVVAPEQLIVTDIRPERLEFFEKTFRIRTSSDNAQAVTEADIILLAVKPQQMSEVLGGLKSETQNLKLIISIAAGVPTARIEAGLGGSSRVVRVMPNTPALVGAGAAALCKGRFATDEDLVTAEEVLSAVGITVKTDEKFLDAVTALSGSGPAYVFLVTEALIKAGIEVGLSEEIAKKLTIHTVAGAAKLMIESGESPESLRKKVTSPGGTTEAALKVMNERNLTKTFAEAVKAATERGRELSGGKVG